MTRPSAPRWKPLAVLVAVFALGGASGAAIGRALTLRSIASTFRGPPGQARAHFRMEALRRELDLTDEQATRLEAIFAEADAERDQLIAACRPGLDELRERTDRRIRELLTDKQRAHYDEHAARRGRGHHGPPWDAPPPLPPPSGR